MVWAYYDESGEYRDGNLLNMSIGCCAAPAESWVLFEQRWMSMLSHYGLTWFHMTDFEAWKDKFDFRLPNGERDFARHKALLNDVLNAIIEVADGFYCFASTSASRGRKTAHRELMEDCVIGAVSHAVHDIWERYREPVKLVFGKQNHFPGPGIDYYVNQYDWGSGKGRIGGITTCYKAIDLAPLQAADVLAYEIARASRPNRPQRYPFQRLVAGAKDKGIPFTLKFGPIRSRTVDFAS